MKFRNENLPDFYVEDYRTLHHDIGLVQRSNGTWDLWFGQDEVSKIYEDDPFLQIIEGDIVNATEVHSLQVGIIIACLTSWNYLNRTGNPIYTEFGNEAYSLLKKNKGVNTAYKIQQFFIDCLNRMRRVNSVESLEVFDVQGNPYLYKVVFQVTSVTNTLVDGSFYLETDSNKNMSELEVNYNHPYTSALNPLFIECTLKDEYGSFISDEIIYIYVKDSSSSKFSFYGITEDTDEYGKTYITIPPRGLDLNTQIMLVFKGNSVYNPCQSKIISIQSLSYCIKSEIIYKKDETGKPTNVIDKQILYIEDSEGNKNLNKFRLGELLSDYVDLEDIKEEDNFPETILSENIPNLEWSEEENQKYYLIPSDRVIEGTDKVYYYPYRWKDNGNSLKLQSEEVQLNTTDPLEIHFLIQEEDNGWFEIDFDDGHLYYKTDLIDYEM